MIRLTVVPKGKVNIYSLMTKKEIQLRRANRGTLHRSGLKKASEEKWVHSTYPGWVRFQKCLGGVVVALIQSRTPDMEWQLLTSLIGFLDRHFRDDVGNISLTYEAD